MQMSTLPASNEVAQGIHRPVSAGACVMIIVVLTAAPGVGAKNALTAAEKAACDNTAGAIPAVLVWAAAHTCNAASFLPG